MASYDEPLAAVTREILQVFCGVDGDAATPRARSESVDGGYRVILSFAGALTGDLVVECSTGFASAATAQTMGTSPDALTDAEMLDVLQEFVNIAAGNLKAVFPRPTTLGLPRPAHLAEPSPADLVAACAFEVNGEPIRVSLFHNQAAA